MRDPKGLYKKAHAGEIAQITGIDSAYEEPEAAEIIICTENLSIKSCARKVISYLKEMHIV